MGKLQKCRGSNTVVSGRKEMIDVACSLQGCKQADDNRFNQRWQAGITTQPQSDLHVQDFTELLALSKSGQALDYQYTVSLPARSCQFTIKSLDQVDLSSCH